MQITKEQQIYLDIFQVLLDDIFRDSITKPAGDGFVIGYLDDILEKEPNKQIFKLSTPDTTIKKMTQILNGYEKDFNLTDLSNKINYFSTKYFSVSELKVNLNELVNGDIEVFLNLFCGVLKTTHVSKPSFSEKNPFNFVKEILGDVMASNFLNTRGSMDGTDEVVVPFIQHSTGFEYFIYKYFVTDKGYVSYLLENSRTKFL